MKRFYHLSFYKNKSPFKIFMEFFLGFSRRIFVPIYFLASTFPRSTKALKRWLLYLRRPGQIEKLAIKVNQAALALIPDASLEEDRARELYYKELAALKTMEYIQAIISSERYAYHYNLQGAKFVPPNNAEKSLKREMGICGNHAAAFVAVLSQLGIKARTISFWYLDKGIRCSHIAAEAYYNGKWHYFDVTWGACFTQLGQDTILSIDQVLADKNRALQINQTNIWFRAAKKALGLEGVFAHLHHKSDITKGDNGTIQAYSLTQEAGVYDIPLTDIPNHVGRNTLEGKGIDYIFDVPPGRYRVEISLAGHRGGGQAGLYINEKKAVFKNKKASLIVQNPATAQVKDSDDICYYVLKNIKMTKLD